MKRENLLLLINTVLLVAVSIIVVLVIYPMFVVEAKDQLFGEKIKLEDKVVIQDVPSQGNFMVIKHKETAMNMNGEVIGTVYTVLAQNVWKFDPNDDAGVIELLVGIQGEHVFVEIVQLRQSSYYLASIQAYVKHFFSGVHYLDVEAISIVNVLEPLAGATIAADSKQAIKDMVFNVVVLHFDIDLEEPDPFVELFDETYAYALKDEAFLETTHVNERFKVYNESDELIGYVFRLYGFSVYNEYGSEGHIDMYLALDVDENILSFLYINYSHTKGGFQGSINNYLKQMVGFHISVFNSEADLETGVTYSGALIDAMLLDLSVVVADYVESDPLAKYFDETFKYAVKNDLFAETTHVKSMVTAYNEDDQIIGYLYTLYGFADYNEYGGEGAIEMYIVFDSSLNILNFEFLRYEHSGGNFRVRVTAYLEMMIGVHISNFQTEADLDSGATYTGGLIDAMLLDLSEVVSR